VTSPTASVQTTIPTTSAAGEAEISPTITPIAPTAIAISDTGIPPNGFGGGSP
jgi:hypothetical protein